MFHLRRDGAVIEPASSFFISTRRKNEDHGGARRAAVPSGPDRTRIGLIQTGIKTNADEAFVLPSWSINPPLQ
jgi:hypothetical protein